MPTQAIPASNRLLANLPLQDRGQILANCEPVDLIYAEVLSRPGELIEHVYFPTGRFISLVTPNRWRRQRKFGSGGGLVGNEGMPGIGISPCARTEPCVIVAVETLSPWAACGCYRTDKETYECFLG